MADQESACRSIVLFRDVLFEQMEAADENGTRPLMFASRGGHSKVVGPLLDAGADPLAATSKGSTPLHFAASAGSPSVRGNFS